MPAQAGTGHVAVAGAINQTESTAFDSFGNCNNLGDGVRAQLFKFLLLGAYLAFDYDSIAERLSSHNFSAMLLVYLGLYAALAVALVAAALIPQTLLRVGSALALGTGSVLLHSYEWTLQSPLDYNSFETMLASRGDIGDAARQHGLVFLKAVLAAFVLFLAIALPPNGLALPYQLHWQIPVLAVLGMAGMLYVRGGEGGRGLPAPFTPLAFATIKTGLLFTEAGEDRQPVKLRRPSHRPVQDIVLIVDESVAGNYIDINHADGVYSGLANPPEAVSIINYGIAASVSDCSAGSNKTLRFGGRRDNYRLVGKVYPSIWAYAKAAGYRAVYLDGQRENGVLHNLMTPDEKAEIDDFVQLDRVVVVERDQRLARLLSDRLTNDRAEFIYVNKVGGHFPVADKFPDRMAKFRPLPARGMTTNIIDMGQIFGTHKGTATEWRLYRNAYRNTIMWNVGSFFETVLPAAARGNAVILYTSDHGQDLHERGNPGKTTHCTSNPPPEDGAVPLVVIESAGKPRLDWQRDLSVRRNASSHFQIFPTLLQLMGYQPSELTAVYGPSLASAQPDDMTFTSNYFAALGRAPTWKKIDPKTIASPPRGDYVQ